MDTKDNFASPKMLISHAWDHIEDASTRITAFFEAKPYARVVDLDSEKNQEVHKARLTKRLPAKISAVVKDAAANLRDALDHAVYSSAVMLTGKSDPQHTGFPFAKDAKGVAGELGGKRLCGNPPEIRPVLASFNPYEGGNKLLWGLNQVRNPNTHRVIVPVGAAALRQTSQGPGGVVNGTLMYGYSRWDADKNEVEFLRITPGNNFQYEVRISFGVVFEEGGTLKGAPVIDTLKDIAAEVGRVVARIESETTQILAARRT